MTHRPPRPLFLAALTLILAVSLAACSRFSSTPTATMPVQGGQLTASPLPATPAGPLEPLETDVFGSELFTFPVYAADGSELAPITGLLVDSLSGQVAYLVLDPPGDEGMHPVPWDALRLGAAGDLRAFESDLSLDELTQSPGLPESFFEQQQVGGEYDLTGWNTVIDRYWREQLGLSEPPDEEQPTGLPIRIPGGLFGGINAGVASLIDEAFGRAADLVVQPDGHLRYVVLETEADLEHPFQFVPLPWAALAWDASQNRFLLLNSRAELLDAPGFASVAEFPDITAPGWDADASSYWEGLLPDPDAEVTNLPADRLLQASLLLGNTIASISAEPLGGVEDLLLAPDGGLAYVVVNNGTTWVPVPVDLVRFNPRTETLVYTGDRADLTTAPVFDTLDDVPRERTAGWDASLRAHWGLENGENGGSGENSQGAPLRASLVVFHNARDREGNSMGVVADLLLDSAFGRRYVVLDFEGKLVMVPWSQFNFGLQSGGLVFTGLRENLAGAPAVNSLAHVHPRLAAWERRVAAYWDGGE